MPSFSPGDFNEDGGVDAADYTVWRDGLDTLYDASHYLLWRANYGAGIVVTPVPPPEAPAIAFSALGPAGIQPPLGRAPSPGSGNAPGAPGADYNLLLGELAASKLARQRTPGNEAVETDEEVESSAREASFAEWESVSAPLRPPIVDGL